MEINPEQEKEETDFDESYPESCDSEKAIKLRYYHFVLETMSESEVHKMLTHKLRRTKKGHVPYLLVMWKPGNRSWISLTP